MAGQKHGVFKELLSPFLRQKLEEARFNGDSNVVLAIGRQYLKDEQEEEVSASDERRRHYEAEIHPTYQGKELRGMEKLYRRVILIEPTTVCAAHCRWCLRGQYPQMNLAEEELITLAKYCGDQTINGEVREVLITGGDPFMIPGRLNVLIDAIIKYAPNIRIIRIGSRVPAQDPERVNDKLLDALRPRDGVRIELGTQVNHRSELFPEVKEAYRKIRSVGVIIYDQTALLKGLNDNISALIGLFDELRYIGIETHYLFHCIPMKGMSHHRTTVEKGLQLIRRLTSCGLISGRCKPMFTAMTDIGKITFYDGAILERKDNKLLLQSHYSYEDRKRWNPHWEAPESVIIDDQGFMRVWYPDGAD